MIEDIPESARGAVAEIIAFAVGAALIAAVIFAGLYFLHVHDRCQGGVIKAANVSNDIGAQALVVVCRNGQIIKEQP